MIPVTIFAGREVAVLGLGLSGLASARALQAGGAIPVLWDDKAEAREEAARQGFAVSDLEAADWSRFAALPLVDRSLCHEEGFRVLSAQGCSGSPGVNHGRVRSSR